MIIVITLLSHILCKVLSSTSIPMSCPATSPASFLSQCSRYNHNNFFFFLRLYLFSGNNLDAIHLIPPLSLKCLYCASRVRGHVYATSVSTIFLMYLDLFWPCGNFFCYMIDWIWTRVIFVFQLMILALNTNQSFYEIWMMDCWLLNVQR